MDAKITVALICVGSLIGGIAGSWLFSGDVRNPTFESVTITEKLVVQSPDDEKVGCWVMPNGSVTATGGVVANQVRGQFISGQNILATTNPLESTLNDQRIMAQMTADPQSGGKIIARNLNAALIPAQGESRQGSAAFISFNPQSGQPEVFTQDFSKGVGSRAFMLTWQRRNEPSGSAPSQEQPEPDGTAANANRTTASPGTAAVAGVPATGTPSPTRQQLPYTSNMTSRPPEVPNPTTSVRPPMGSIPPR